MTATAHSEERCETCRFFHVPDSTSSGYNWQRSTYRGECRIRAPGKGWPDVHGDDWCGEFSPKAEG